MADYVAVAQYRFDDQVSAGANAAAAALDSVATAAETTTASVTRSGPSFQTLSRRHDDATRAAAALAKAERDLANATARAAEATASGAGTQAQADAITAALTAKVTAARAAVDNLGQASSVAGVALGKLTPAQSAAANGASALAGMSKETAYQMKGIALQMPDVVQGILGGQSAFQVLVQQGGQVVQMAGGVRNAFSLVTTLLGGPLVAGALAAGAALVYLAGSAESADRQTLALSAGLRITRDDYVSLTAEIERSARAMAATGTISQADATTAGKTIGSTRDFTGDESSLRDLISLSADVARAFDEGIAAAAGRVAAALKAPKDAAQAFADQGLRGMSQSLADTAAALENSGHKAEASAVVIGALRDSVGGAKDSLTPLQKALRDVSTAFSTGTDGSTSFAHAIGDALAGAAAIGLDAIAGLLSGLNGAYKAVTDMRGGNSKPLAGIDAGLQTPIQAAATAAGLDPQAVATIHALEGVRNPDGTWQTSARGAVGPMQMMPDTFKEVAAKYGIAGDITDDTANFKAGALYLRDLIAQFKSTDLGVAAYNAGPGRVAGSLKDGTALPDETSAYVRNFRSAYAGNPVTGPGLAPGGAMLPNLSGGTGGAQYGTDQGLVDQAMKAAGGIGGTGITIDKLQGTLDLLQRAQGLTLEGSADWQKLQSAIESTRAALAKTDDPIQALVRSTTASVKPLQAAEGAERALAEAHQQLAEAERASGREASPGERAAVETAALAKLNAELAGNLAQLDRQTAGQRALAAAYGDGATSAREATAAVKAQEDARKVAVPGTAAYASAVAALTQRYRDSASAAADVTTAQRNLAAGNELEFLQKQASLIGATVEQRDRELAVLRERQRLIADGADLESEASRRSLALASQVADATTALNRQKSAFDGLASVGEQAFDRIGSSITQAFANGSLQTLKFGDIARAVLSEIVQYAAKIAIINPALNSVFGGSRSTITDLFSATSGSGASSTGGGFNLSSLGNLFGGGSLSSTLDNFGAYNLGGLGFTNATNTALSGMSGYGPATASQVTSAASSLNGGLLNGGSALGGFSSFSNVLGTAGSILPGLMSGNYLQAGLGGAGAAIGTILLPGIGTAIGGALGNLVGSLFGPKPSDHTAVGTYDTATGVVFQSSGPKETKDTQGGRQTALDAMQQAYQQLAALVGSTADLKAKIGVGTRDGTKLVTTQNGVETKHTTGVGDIGGIVAYFKNDLVGAFTDAAGDVKKVLDASAGNYDQAIAGLTFLQGDYKTLTAGVSDVGSVKQAMDTLAAVFDAATASAEKFGLATGALADEQTRQAKIVTDAAATVVAQGMTGLDIRYLTATGDTAGAATLNFDTNAQQQREQWSAQLTGLFGTAYKASADYAAQMGKLNDTLDAERANLIKALEPNLDPGRQAVTNSAASLSSFIQSLMTGAASPLSAQDKYASASSAFQGSVGQAAAGEYGALAQAQNLAADFLTQSRNLNGSGAQYTADVSAVVDSLSRLANASTDALTESAMRDIQATQTDRMVEAMAELRAQLAAIRLELQQATAAPV